MSDNDPADCPAGPSGGGGMAVPTTTSLYGDAIAAIEEARLHGYSLEAAIQAALDHLALADHAEAIVIAALLAGLIATTLNPTATQLNLAYWLSGNAAMFTLQAPS